MPKLTSLLIAFVLMNQIVYAQNEVPGKNSISWSPFRMADPVNPGIELGFERSQGKKYALSISAGYMTRLFDMGSFTNYKGMRLSVEEKAFVPFGPEFSNRNYVSAETVFLNVKYSSSGQFAADTSLNAASYYDSFRVSKQTLALNIKFGFLLDVRIKKFFVDFSVGAGLKYKMVKRNGLIDPDAFELSPRHPNAYFTADKRGNYFTGNLPVNIKLIYSL